MDERQMSYANLLPLSAPLVVFLALLCGIGIGVAYFYALRVTADVIVAGGSPLRALGLTFGRLALMATGLYVAALNGALPLLAALSGVLIAKAISLRQGAAPRGGTA